MTRFFVVFCGFVAKIQRFYQQKRLSRTQNSRIINTYSNKQELVMDLMQIVKENPRARAIILEMNVAVIAVKYGIKFAEAKSLQQYAALLDMKEAA